MTWIKEANKIGRYDQTYKGFRFYCTKEKEIAESIVERADGLYNRIDFIKGWFIAIDKTGDKVEGDDRGALRFKIEVIHVQRYYDKKDLKEEQKENKKICLKNQRSNGQMRLGI